MNWKFFVPVAMITELVYGLHTHNLGWTLIGGMFLAFWLMIAAYKFLCLVSDVSEIDTDTI